MKSSEATGILKVTGSVVEVDLSGKIYIVVDVKCDQITTFRKNNGLEELLTYKRTKVFPHITLMKRF